MVQQCRRCGQVHDPFTGCTLAFRVARRPTFVGDDEALVGNVVAERYRVRDVLGVGSTGTVFAVEHVTFARAGAMKVLRPRFASAEQVSRVFHGEARAAWSVSHPCLCEVFDIGTLPDGAPFFVMERLEGETLAARIMRERLSLAAAVDAMMQLLSAIVAVHARDLLVRDLRPENVFLAHRRGCRPLVKILDFGLARLIPLDRLQRDWASTGDPGFPAEVDTRELPLPFYLSPERVRGEHAVEPASDLFVAATIFYEALTGVRPFSGTSWSDLVSKIAEGEPTPLNDRRPDVPPELSAFVLRCLSADPRSRPASAKEMQDELRASVEGMRRGSISAVPAAAIAVPGRGDNVPSPFASVPAPPMARPAGASSERRPPSGSYERGSARDVAHEEESVRPSATAGRLPIPALPRDTVIPRLSSADPEDELATEARRMDLAVLRVDAGEIDEASADSADRTVPPPASFDIDITFEDSTEQGAVPAAAAAIVGAAEDEETETMELTPELRARVDQLMATKPAPVPVVSGATAKPPRRR